MQRILTVSDSVTVDASPWSAWEAVADVTQMGRWSPENTGARVPSSGPLAVGDSFVGTNRRGRRRWTTQCTVTAADPGKRFAFRVHRIGASRPVLRGRIATWDYHFEKVEGGTRVTETWTDDRRWPDAAAAIFDKAATGGHLFADFQRRNIRHTLEGLRRELGQD